MDEDLIIETERLILRRYRLDDVNDIVEGLNNLNVTKWLAGAPYPYTKDDALHFINKSLDNNLYNFAIVTINIARRCGLAAINRVVNGGIWS